MNRCLIIADRDGTLIEPVSYLGRFDDWQSQVVLLSDTISRIKAYEKHYPDSLKMVFTNQTGVALGYFSEEKVREVNQHIDSLLREHNLYVHEWLYAPQADEAFFKAKGLAFNSYVVPESNRKPNPKLVLEALKERNLQLSDFEKIVVFGDRHEDEGLAKNLGAVFEKVEC